MTSTNTVSIFTAQANYNSLITGIGLVTKALYKLQTSEIATNLSLDKTAEHARNLSAAFATTLVNSGQWANHVSTVGTAVQRFGSHLDKGQLKLKDYYGAYKGHLTSTGGLINQLAQQQVRMQNSVVTHLETTATGMNRLNVAVANGLDTQRYKTQIAKQEMQIFNKVLHDGGIQMVNWGKNTQWAGRQLTVGLTLPLVLFGKVAADAFKKSDVELVRLTKVYGGIAATSAADLAKIRTEVAATAKELSASYGSAYTETIALAADIAAAGKTGEDLINATKQTTRLAVLGEVSHQDAMKATLAIQNTFKQNTDELAKSIDFLNAVENQTSTSLDDLVSAIPRAGSVVKAMGGDVKDLSLLLVAMKEGGIDASLGANALKSALAALINPTEKAQDMYRSFGIDLGGIVKRNAGNLIGTITELQGALDKIDPQNKQKAIEQLFGKFQFARMNALFANLGKQGSQTLQVMDLMKASSQDLANIASRELAQVTTSASGKYRRAVESLKADLAGMGESFLNLNANLLGGLDKLIKFVSHIPGPIKHVLTLLGGFVAVSGPIIMLAGVFANFAGYVLSSVANLKRLFSGVSKWKEITVDTRAATAAQEMFAKSTWDENKAMNALAQAFANASTGMEVFGKSTYDAIMSQEGIQKAIALTNSLMSKQAVLAAASSGASATRPVSAHMVPRATTKNDPNAPAPTIFSFVPGDKAVNTAVGKNPMIYSGLKLPDVPGLTTIGGASTQVSKTAAARWHTLTATLAIQSEEQLAQLKAEMETTGQISQRFQSQFSALLPQVKKIMSNTARTSAAVVKEVQSGVIGAQEAQKRIVEINYLAEKLLAQATRDAAAAAGTVANLTSVPLLPGTSVVGHDGSSQMRALLRNSASTKKPTVIASTFSRIADFMKVTQKPGRFNILKKASGGTIPGTGNQDTVPALLTPGEFVVNKKATEKNLPFLQAINNNSIKRYATGNLVRKNPVTGRFESYSPQISTQEATTPQPSSGNGMMRSMGGALAVSLIGTTVGSKVGGTLGQIISMASMFAPMFLGIQKNSDKAIKSVSVLARTGSLAAKSFAGIGRSVLMFSKGNPYLLVTSAALAVGIGLWKRHNDLLKTNALGYGLTAKSASTLKLSLTDLGQTLKDSQTASKNLAEKNQMVYDSLTSANQPLKITIAEYSKLKKVITNTLPEYVKLFDSTKVSDVGDVAVRLKAQFVAAGMSAEEATKHIYTMIQVSNKRGLGGTAINTEGFGSIVNRSTAATSSVGSFNQAVMSGSTKYKYEAVVTAINAINSGVDSLIGKGKNEISVASAIQKQMKLINTHIGEQALLGHDVVAAISKQNPELGAVLKSTDNIVGAWAKYQLLIEGSTANIKNLSSEAARALVTMDNIISKVTQTTLQKNLLKDQYSLLDSLTAKRLALTAQVSRESSVQEKSDKQIRKSLNAQIKKINDLADAKKKAMQISQDAASTELEIEKEKLLYQQALATGNRDAAAQAQLNIQKMVGESQTKAAEQRISDNADKAIAPLQARLDALSDKDTTVVASAAQKALDATNKKIDDLTASLGGLSTAISPILQAINDTASPGYRTSAVGRAAIANLAASTSDASLAELGIRKTKTQSGGRHLQIPKTALEIGNEIVDAVNNGVSKGINIKGSAFLTAKSIFLANEKQTEDIAKKTAEFAARIPGATFIGGRGSAAVPKITRKSSGGMVSGPGTGTSDSIPAMLSNGEYVVNARSASKIGYTNLNFLNKMADGGVVAKFNLPQNAMVGALPTSSGGQNISQYFINVELNGTNITTGDVTDAIMRQMKIRESMNGRVRTIR